MQRCAKFRFFVFFLLLQSLHPRLDCVSPKCLCMNRVEGLDLAQEVLASAVLGLPSVQQVWQVSSFLSGILDTSFIGKQSHAEFNNFRDVRTYRE